MNRNKESYLKLKSTVRNRLVSAFEKAQLVMTRPKLKDDKSCKSLKQKTLSWKATKTKKFPPEDSNETISDISISDDEDLNELEVDIKTPNLSNQMDLKKSENATTFKTNQTLKRSCLSPESEETSAKIPRTINKTKNYSNIASENMRNYLLPKLSHCTDGEISKQSRARSCLKSNSQNDIGLNKAKNGKVDKSDSHISLTEYIALSDDESCVIPSNCRSSINDQSTETESPLPNLSDIIFKSPSSKFNIKESWIPGRKYVIRSLHAYDIEGLWDGHCFNVTGCHGKNRSISGSWNTSDEVEKLSISSDSTMVGDSKATLESRKCMSSLVTKYLRSQEDAHSKTSASQLSQNPKSTLSSSPRSHRKDGKPAPSGDSPLKSDTCLDLSDSVTDAQRVFSQDYSDIKLPTTQKNVRRSTPRKRFLDLVQLSSDDEDENKGSSTTTETNSLVAGSVGLPPEHDMLTSANCIKLSELVFQSRSCSCNSCSIEPGGIHIQLNKNKTTKSLDLYIRSDEIISIGCCTGVTSQTEIHMTVSNKCSGRLREIFDVKPSKTNNQSYGQLILQVSEMERLEKVRSMMLNMDRKSSSAQSNKTSSVKSDEEKKTSPVKSDKEKITSPVKSDKEKITSPVKSDKEKKTSSVKLDKEKKTLPVKSDTEKQTLPVKLDKEKQTLPVKSDKEKQTLPVKSDKEKQTLPVKSDKEKQTLPVKSDKEKQTSPVKSDKEKQTLPVKSDKEKQTLPVKSDKEKKTSSVKLDKEKKTLPVKSDTEKQTLPVKLDKEKQTLPVKSDKEKQTLPVKSDKEKQTLPVKSDKEKQTLPVKSDKEKQTSPVKSDKEKQTLPVKSDKEKQTLPVKSDKERKSLSVKSDKERKSLSVKLDQEKITSFVNLVREKKKSSEKLSVESDEEKNTSSVKSDREKKTLSIKSDVEKKISTAQSDKEKKTKSQNEASDTRNDRYRTRSSQTKLSRSGSTPAIVKLFDYPPSQSVGRISVTNEDLRCLNAHEFLNDVIIDFYLKYLHSELLSPADRSRTHIFSSFFFGRMMAKQNRTECDDDSLSLAQKRHALVQTWTRHVDLFSKDFIVIPINESAHWFLAVICFPWLCDVGNSETEQTCSNGCSSEEDLFLDPPTKIPSKETDDGNSSDLVKHPCILIFDSLGGSGRWNAPNVLRDYLQTEWDRKKSTTEGTRTFDKLTMKSCRPRCPQQTNFSDCGIYLLQYVESFFKTPLKNFTPPIISLKQWFPSHETKNKRHAIQTLILQLTQKLNPSLDYEPEADGCHLVNVKENN